MVGISASGAVLLFQAIWHGKPNKSYPSSTAVDIFLAGELGFRFEPSKTATYWSTFPLMNNYVEQIVPYFSANKERLGVPEAQRLDSP